MSEKQQEIASANACAISVESFYILELDYELPSGEVSDMYSIYSRQSIATRSRHEPIGKAKQSRSDKD